MKTIKMIMDVPIDVYTRFVTLNLGTPLYEVLDKIRAEIEQRMDGYEHITKDAVFAIIDKCREEKE